MAVVARVTQAALPSPRSPAAGVLRQIAVRGLLADVVLLVVAMALGGVEGNIGRAAGPLVALVLVGNGLDGFGERFCHRVLRCSRKKTTHGAQLPFPLEQPGPPQSSFPDAQLRIVDAPWRGSGIHSPDRGDGFSD